MKKILTLITIFAFILVGAMLVFPSTTSAADVKEEWVARYNGPANSYDAAYDIALDNFGNVYVTGSGGTIKYDTNGNELWSAGYGGNAITLDDFGNVYVTGGATIKYDTNGNELWSAGYNGGVAYAIAVDNFGNVYVTGTPWGSGSGPDYATVKYDTNGNELWVAGYNSPEDYIGLSHLAQAIAVDSSGNVYVTGWSGATIKYDTNGNELWVANFRYPSQIAVDYVGNVITLDDFGNVYVAGCGATIKYDTNGNELWVGYHGCALGVSLDDFGNVYVTGYSGTIKYDTNGNELWSAGYGGLAYAIAVDNFGNVYVTGDGGLDYTTIKYDTNGNELWSTRYNGPANHYDSAFAIAVDNFGNVYVTGTSASSSLPDNYDYATIKYSQPPQIMDADSDGIPDDEDNCPAIVNPGQEDNEGDGLGDVCDPDDDNDGVLDENDSCPFEDAAGSDANLDGCIDTLTGLQQIINTLSDDVLSDEIKNSLASKVDNALKSVDKEKDTAAINMLEAFINEVNAQRGKKISEEAAGMLIEYANNVIAQIQTG